MKFCSFVKHVDQKPPFQILEKIYKGKEGILDAYKIDEIDVDSYFFYNFLDILIQHNTKLTKLTYIHIFLQIFGHFNPTEKFDLVKDLNIQRSLLKNLNTRSLLRNSLLNYPQNCMHANTNCCSF